MQVKKKLILAFIITLLITLLSLYRPNKNIQQEAGEADFLVYESAPKDIANLFISKCYDCHSNKTNYKWFDHIFPASIIVDNNIKQGKYLLNFSNWGNTTLLTKEIIFSAVNFDIEQNLMPPKTYLKFHADAKLSEEEKVKMLDWIKNVKVKTIWGKED